jgi:antitoxin PrlF
VESAITTKGQATNSKGYPGASGVEASDRVKFFMHPDASVILLPKRPASVLRGIVKPRRRPATIEEIVT